MSIYWSFTDKSYGVPFLALAMNMSWEFIYSFVLHTNIAKIQLYINRIWFFLDVIIFAAYVLYGLKEWSNQSYRKWFYPHLVFCVAGAGLLLYYMDIDMEYDAMTLSAFMINLLMSVLFINMILKRNTLKAQSFGIAMFKLTGTLCATIILFQDFSIFLRLIGVITSLLDVVYLVLVLNMYKKEQLHPITRKFLNNVQ